MRAIATALSCLALLSCSTESEPPRSPLLDQVVRAPGVVWSNDTLDCRQILSEDKRIDALSRANEIEKKRLTRARNIQLIEWLIPYYGWVAAARAGALDEELKGVDLVIEDAGDRRLELNQYVLAKGCTASAETTGAPVVAPATAAPASVPIQIDAKPDPRRHASVARPARPTSEAPMLKPPPTRPPVVPPLGVFAQVEAPPPSEVQSGMRVEGNNVFLTLGPGADLDRIAADLKLALQQH
jgi:hypothetical protein